MAKKTYEQYWLEQQEARRAAARAANQVHDSSMTHDVRARIEKNIGRKLTPAEIIRGRLDRTDDRPSREKLAAEKFAIVMEGKGGEIPYAAEIRAGEELVAREKFALLSPAEKRLAMTKELSLKKLQEAASKADHEARLNDPTVAAALATLKDLQNRAAFSNDWDYGDCEALDRAVQQLTTPGACLKTGLALADAAVGIFNTKQRIVVDNILAQRADLEQQLVELGAVEYQTSNQATVDEAEYQAASAAASAATAKSLAALEHGIKLIDTLKGIEAHFGPAELAAAASAYGAPAPAPVEG